MNCWKLEFLYRNQVYCQITYSSNILVSSIVNCLGHLLSQGRKIFTFSFANSEYASFSLRNNLGSFIRSYGFFKLSAILLMFLYLFLFYFCLCFLTFLRLHFLSFSFSFQILFSLTVVASMCLSLLRFVGPFSCQDSSNYFR